MVTDMDSLETLLKKGHTQEARAKALELLKTSPADKSALLTMVKAHLVEGEVAEAEARLGELEKQGVTVDTLICRGNLAMQREQEEAARAAFKEALAMKPERAEAHQGMGIIHAASSEYEASLKHFQRAVELEPKHGIYHYHLAQNFLALERPLEAVDHATAAVQFNPLYPPGYALLARMLLVSGKAQKAQKVLQAGLKALPGNEQLLSELTNVNLVGGNVGGAFHSAAQLAQQHPDDPVAMGNLALMLLAQNRHAEVMEICKGFEARGLSTAPLKCIEATVHEAHQPPDYPAAIACYEQAMALDQEDWTAANNLGQLLMRIGDDAMVPRAITALEEAMRRKPGQLEPVLNLALAFARAKQPKKSEALAQHLLSFGLPSNDPLRTQAEKLVKALKS
jgi:tetratricopeptide (TPR) repeat protein